MLNGPKKRINYWQKIKRFSRNGKELKQLKEESNILVLTDKIHNGNNCHLVFQ
jgi:hypothetical protein